MRAKIVNNVKLLENHLKEFIALKTENGCSVVIQSNCMWMSVGEILNEAETQDLIEIDGYVPVVVVNNTYPFETHVLQEKFCCLNEVKPAESEW